MTIKCKPVGFPHATNIIQGVSEGILNILGIGSMDYSG